MTPASRPRYLEPDCPLTLAEGLAELTAANPNLITTTDPELHELVRAHDSCHVLFGLTTTLEDEALADTWTLCGSDVTLKQYSAYLEHQEFTKLLHELGWWPLLRSVIRSVPQVVRAIGRARKMTAKWPFFGYAQFLDTPLVTLRRRFNVVPL